MHIVSVDLENIDMDHTPKRVKFFSDINKAEHDKVDDCLESMINGDLSFEIGHITGKYALQQIFDSSLIFIPLDHM